MAAELRALNADGSYSEILPDWSDLTFSQDILQPGTLTFSYPSTGGRNAHLLDHGQQFAILLDGNEPKNGRFTYDEGTGSRIAESDGTSTYACKSNLARLDKLMLAPGFTSIVITPTDVLFVNVAKTVGFLLANAINNGVLRGNSLTSGAAATVPWLTWPLNGFTTTNDSTGASWVVTHDVTFNAGNTAADVLAWVVENGFAEPMMDGKILRLYRPENNGRDLATIAKPIVLQVGRDFTEATYETTSADLVNSVLVTGENNSCVWVKNQPSIDKFGYREGTYSVSGADKTPTLTDAGNAYIGLHATERTAYTYTVAAMYLEQSYGRARPFIDYQVGDTILIFDGVDIAARRLRLLSATWPNSTAASVNLSVNDWFNEREVEFERRLKRLGG